MNDKTPSQDEWVPWREGAEVLGISRGSFFHLVDTHQVRAEPGRGPRSGRYSMEDILEVKKRREEGKPRKPYRKRTPAAQIGWLRVKDVPAALVLDYSVYQRHFLAEAERYEKWREKNEYISIAAFDKQDRGVCWGYLGLVPLPEQVILAILKGDREEKSIGPEEIETYDRAGGYYLLANSVVIHPDHPELLLQLIHAAMNFWVDQFPEKYVRKVYAQSVSERGDLAIQMFRMAPRYDLQKGSFELDLARPGLAPLVRDFQKRLKEKASLPPDLQLFPPDSGQEK